jgi:hypothetical protein
MSAQASMMASELLKNFCGSDFTKQKTTKKARHSRRASLVMQIFP